MKVAGHRVRGSAGEGAEPHTNGGTVRGERWHFVGLDVDKRDIVSTMPGASMESETRRLAWFHDAFEVGERG